MAKRLLTDLPTFVEGGDLNVIIETPRGSRNKCDYDPKEDLFELAGVMPEGSAFPYDFGFVPGTLGEDGDPLDVLVFMDAPGLMGCRLTARLIGVIEAEQTDDDEVQRNDRLLAVASVSLSHQHVQALDALRPGLLDEIEEFFMSYNKLKGKEFRPLRRGDATAARQAIEEGQRKYREAR